MRFCRGRAFAVPVTLLLAATAALSDKPPSALQPQTEAQFAAQVLAAVQDPSFTKEVEFCGYIGRDADGALVATDPVRGDYTGCDMPRWPRNMTVVASYHTHANHTPDFDSEFPSALDMEVDEADGIDGYVATPGGRLWFIDTSDMVASMICGLNCLPQDPDFQPLTEPQQLSYTYEELLRRERY